MRLFLSLHSLLDQLEHMLEQVSAEAFTTSLPVLSGATIGQHTRHLLEFFVELDKGYITGVVCYDRRERDTAIENDRRTAMNVLQSVRRSVERPNIDLTMQAVEEQLSVTTNYYRELVYNIEHAVHHMALLRIGIASCNDVYLPAEFGVAASTIHYRKQCAQ